MELGTKINYYEILEIKANSPQHEVTTAFERARATYSGDNPAIYTIFTEQEARELLRMVQEAYDVLGNKSLRTLYDERLLGGNYRSEDLTYEALLLASKQNLPEPKKTPSKNFGYKVDADFEKEILSNENWSGEFLKKVREYKGYSLDKMSEITKVTQFYLNALEQMNSANLPATVFIRGYVIQVARTLGLDDKKVADSYMKILKTKGGANS